MTKVDIIYSYNDASCQILLDETRIDGGDSLAPCETTPLHLCADTLLALLDKKIGGEYAIHLTGFPFQTRLLSALAEKSAHCAQVEGTELEAALPMEKRMPFFTDLARKYHLSCAGADLRIPVTGNAEAKASLHFPFLVMEGDSPELQIEYPQLSFRDSCGTVVVLANAYELQREDGACILTIPSEESSVFLDYYYKACKCLPFIGEVTSACRYLSLSEEDKRELAYMTTLEPQYFFQLESDSFEVGRPVNYLFRSFPDSAYSFHCSRYDIFTFGQDTITASEEGPARFYIADQEGETVLEREVTCFRSLPADAELPEEPAPEMPVPQAVVHEISDPDAPAEEPSDPASSEPESPEPPTEALPDAAQDPAAQAPVTQEPAPPRPVQGAAVQASPAPSPQYAGTAAAAAYAPPAGAYRPAANSQNIPYGGTQPTGNAMPPYSRPGYAPSGAAYAPRPAVTPANRTPVRSARPTALIVVTLIITILGLLTSFTIPVFCALRSILMGILGYLANPFLLPALILSVIGVSRYSRFRVFLVCLILNLVFTVGMFVLGILL